MSDIGSISLSQTTFPGAAKPATGGEGRVGLNIDELARIIDGMGGATVDPDRSDPRPPATPQALDAAIAQFNRSVNFRVDADSGQQVITIRDRATGETIRQIPSDTFLALAEHMDEMRGILFEKVA